MTIDKNLEELFGGAPTKEPEDYSWVDVKPIEVETPDGVLVPVSKSISSKEIREKESVDIDFEISRKNLLSLLESGQAALRNATILAESSEDPKAYQVVSGLIKNLASINEQMLNLHLKHQHHKIKKSEVVAPVPEQPKLTNNTTNNAIFVGSSTELTQFIERVTKGS